MKKTVKLVGFFVFLMIIGFIFAACDDSNLCNICGEEPCACSEELSPICSDCEEEPCVCSEEPSPICSDCEEEPCVCSEEPSPLTGTVTITGNAQVGETLTANTSNLRGSGTISYQWRLGGTDIGANHRTYTVHPTDVNSTITVTVTRTGNTGSVISNPTAPITTGAPTAGLHFTLINNDTAYSVSRGSAAVAAIVIPSIHNGLPVREISDWGFLNFSSMTNITIPDSVTSIGESAFSGCTSLESIIIPFVGARLNGTTNTHFGFIFGAPNASGQNTFIPASLRTVIVTGGNTIANNAFQNCSGLTSISILGNVISIGQNAFSGCTGLESITIGNSVTISSGVFSGLGRLQSIHVDNNHPNFASQDGILYSKGKTQLILVPRGIKGSITIPDSVMSIGNSAFQGCTGLTSITIPDRVMSIGSSAFQGCTGLTSITIPNRVISIGNGAFWGCTSLESITIPFVGNTLNGTTNTHFGFIFGFSSDLRDNNEIPTSLRTVVITGGNSIGALAFWGCTRLTSITIPDSVTSIGDGAFQGCTGLESIHVGINNPNFASQDGILYNKGKTQFIHVPQSIIGSVTIPDSVISIGDSAFSSRRGLTNITIPNRVASIGSNAFQGCSSLESITIPFVGNTLNGTTNTHFGFIFGAPNAFGQNTFIPASLRTVTITGGNTIPNNAFFGCTGLTSITIPDSVTSIGSFAFSDCTGLESIHVGINNPNFASQDGILYNKGKTQLILAPGGIKGSITIPDSVTSIGNAAFFGCTGLTSVTLPNNPNFTRIDDLVFYGCTGLTSITIPDSVTSIGNMAFRDCTGLIQVTLGTINFDFVFPGNLHTVYFTADGGAGTYVRDFGSNVWRKL